MISNSVTSEKHRRASGGQPRLSLGRVSISRQVAPICREDEDENDVEAVPRQPTPPPQPKVMKPTRRRSSINRTRETIVRLLRDQDNQKPLDARKSIADSLLSTPIDWLVGGLSSTTCSQEGPVYFKLSKRAFSRYKKRQTD